VWSADQTYKVTIESVPSLKRKVMAVDVSTAPSVGSLVEELVAGRIDCPGGICLAFSGKQQTWWLVYRSDQKDAAHELLHVEQRAEESVSDVEEDVKSWAPSQAWLVPEETDMVHLKTQVKPFDKRIISSVNTLVNHLIEGHMQCPGGMCLVWSESKQSWWLVYRSDKKAAAFPLLNPAAGTTAAARSNQRTVLSDDVTSFPGLTERNEDELASASHDAAAMVPQATSFHVTEKSKEEEVLQAELQELLNEITDLKYILHSCEDCSSPMNYRPRGRTTAEKVQAARRKLGSLTRRLEARPAVL